MEAVAEILEPQQVELKKQQTEVTDRQELSIINYRRMGIDIEVLEDNFIKITHARFKNRILLNQKELYERARKIFPDKKYKIIAVVHCLRPSEITKEWIVSQMDELGIKRNDLIKQLGIDKAYLSLLLSDKPNKRSINLSRSMKATFFYYFLSYRLSQDFRNYIDSIQKIGQIN